MKLRPALALSLLPALFILTGAQAQDSVPSSLTEAILVYTHSPAADARLYNGIVYLGYDRHAQGHPFFMSDSSLPGSVCYDGIVYPQETLSYDMDKGILIIPDRRKTLDIQLLSEKIRWFTIGQHRFVHLTPDSNAVNAPEAGFYEELYRGKATAWAWHEKRMLSGGDVGGHAYHYQQYDHYYLELNGRFYTIHNNSSLLNAFGTGKDEIKTFLRKSRISFKKNPEHALTAAAEYYTQLKKN